MRKKTTVATRIWLIVGLCLGVGASATGVLVHELRTTSASYEAALRNLQDCARQQDAARVMQVTFKKEVQEWKDILLRGYKPEDLAKYSGQFRAAADKVAEVARVLQSSVTDAEAHRTVEQFLQAHTAMRETYEGALRSFTEAKGETARETDQAVKGQDRATTDLIDKVVAGLAQRSNAAVASQSEAVAGKIGVVSLAVLAAFAGISLIVGFTIQKTAGTLRHAVADLSETSSQVASAASQVASSSQCLAQGSAEQAASLEETSSASAEINSMACRNSENSRVATDLATQSALRFVETNQKLDLMTSAMEEINSQSGKISKIIKVIDEIAFQTNILALNAAVEAARAGEAGMGFAVVADEVRNLAQRCAQAARDTTALIEESIGKSHEGKVRMDQVAAVLRTMTEDSSKVKALVEVVSSRSQEQTRGIEQVTRAIAQMEQTTQQTAAGAEEGAAAAEQLTAQSHQLNQVAQHLSALVGGQARAAKPRR